MLKLHFKGINSKLFSSYFYKKKLDPFQLIKFLSGTKVDKKNQGILKNIAITIEGLIWPLGYCPFHNLDLS